MVSSIDRTGVDPGAPPLPSFWAAGPASSTDDNSGAVASRLASAQRRQARWLRVDLVDVRQSTVQRVRIWTEGPMLQIAGQSLLRQVPLAQIDWRHQMGPARRRMARLPDGSALCAVQPQDWDDWFKLAVPSATGRHTPTPWLRLGVMAAALGLMVLGTWFFLLPATQG